MSVDKITQIATDKIDIRDDRLRFVDESAVKALVHDINNHGQTQAIEVRKLSGGRFELIDGGHRLAAVEQLGWKVKAIVRDCTADEAKLRMALANLARAELSMLDRARHVWRVKSMWQQMNPDRTHGGFREAGECQAATMSTWTEAIPEAAHLSDRTLARAAEIGEKIAYRAAIMIYDTSIANNQKELLALIKYGPDLQCAIAEKIAAGKAKTVAQGAALVAGEPEAVPEPIPVAKQVNKMWQSFEKMTDDARDQFIQVLKNEGII